MRTLRQRLTHFLKEEAGSTEVGYAAALSVTIVLGVAGFTALNPKVDKPTAKGSTPVSATVSGAVRGPAANGAKGGVTPGHTATVSRPALAVPR
jgi:hypothetical protein